MQKSVYWYIRNLRILTNTTYFTSLKETVVSSFFNLTYSIITNKVDLIEGNARIKQVLKENGCQKSIISKIFKRITNNHSLSQSQQQTQAINIQEEELRMSINLPSVEARKFYMSDGMTAFNSLF